MNNPTRILALLGLTYLGGCVAVPRNSLTKFETNAPQPVTAGNVIIPFSKESGSGTRHVNVYAQYDPVGTDAKEPGANQWLKLIVTEGNRALSARPPRGHNIADALQGKVELYSPWEGAYSLVIPYAHRPATFTKITLSESPVRWVSITESTATPPPVVPPQSAQRTQATTKTGPRPPQAAATAKPQKPTKPKSPPASQSKAPPVKPKQPAQAEPKPAPPKKPKLKAFFSHAKHDGYPAGCC